MPMDLSLADAFTPAGIAVLGQVVMIDPADPPAAQP